MIFRIYIGGVALALAMLAVAPARAMEPGDDQYPNSILAPERGTANGLWMKSHARTKVVKSSHGRVKLLARSKQRRSFARRGSGGIVLPTHLPRTRLIPPEGAGIASVPRSSQDPGLTIVPGTTNGIPNLPHGSETFQDRASRCAHQQGLYGVPSSAASAYTSACAM
jgi:hypothetical protein